MKYTILIDSSTSWHKLYKDLEEFIAGHPEISIRHNIVQVPEAIRPRFYCLFDAIRMAFIEQACPGLADRATILIKEFRQAENELKGSLSVNEISIPPHQKRFIDNPAGELTRETFHALFDLLQGKIKNAEFEPKAVLDISSSFMSLSQAVYEKWVVLSLMKLLGANKLFQVQTGKITLNDLWKRGFVALETAPLQYESNTIRFNMHAINEMFIIPDVIFYSPLLKKYVSVRSEIGRPLGTASNRSQKREWFPNNLGTFQTGGITVFYLSDNPGEITLIADKEKICRPDLVVKCEYCSINTEFKHTDTIEKQLKPQLGTCFISGGTEEGLVNNSKFIKAGFNLSNLKTVIEIMKEYKEKTTIDNANRNEIN